ncbi:MAG: hypothetical protein GTO55_02220 [Armatimonadetes bacterium]|nr:hypothetical protein [Armatimonadota bacterium]NIM23094.1 hypothetical protein [Armatimonadota bacterium]NIM66962.1 hypothetical protein [Armatimonadota bacterium]NIM75496.1 hypothetical protein [Armatimonadota bacterium]NIN05153.1 hypothetical protein [Armatimonadota bacterium]
MIAMQNPTFFLYDENTAESLRSEELAEFLKGAFAAPVEVREEFVGRHLGRWGEEERRGWLEELARRFAYLRVRDVNRENSFSDPLPMEVDVERRRLLNENRGSFGMAVDGFQFQACMRELLPVEERGLQHLHIIFTNRLLATWEADDRRYHLRTIILGQPAVISTSGLVEAPAKPREYYLIRQRLPDDELARVNLLRQFAGRFLEHSDARTNQVVKGYLMQAAFYLLFGERFCKDPDCRLFNAHWQEEMLHAQLRPEAGLCEKHEEMVEELRAKS